MVVKMSGINKKFLRKYYESEALAGHHQKRMYDPSLDPWNFHFYHEPRLSETMRWLTFARSMLDIGCAEGLFVKLFLGQIKHNDSLSAVGVDISSSYVHKAKDVEPRGYYCVADASALPFRDKSIDVCLCSEVLEHLVDAEKALAEGLRISKKYFVVTTPGSTLFHSLAFKLGILGPQFRIADFNGPYKGHINNINAAQLATWARKYKSKIVYSRTGCFIPPLFFAIFKVPLSLVPVFKRIDSLLSKIPILRQQGLLQIDVISRNAS